MNTEELEQTLVLIKPDALKNSLTGYVLSLLSETHTGLRFAAAKIVHVSKMLAEEHYAEHVGKIFYPSLIEYITGRIHYPNDPWKRRVVAFVYQGPGATLKIRDLCGPTNPHVAREQKPGCIRALGTVVPLKDATGAVIGERMDNLIHASATDAEAEREIKLWFKPNDIPPFMRPYITEASEEHYYVKDGVLSMKHTPGSNCLLAPGDLVWKSDLEALRALHQGAAGASCSLASVAAKYLINEKWEEH
ncbi:MAG: nucleoside-diphosphate kinase [Candidatus Sumerlaeota bacterium]|nr:nucleoside-diphosphate kinase [Candidatus Sumerlaeota bacterium]